MESTKHLQVLTKNSTPIKQQELQSVSALPKGVNLREFVEKLPPGTVLTSVTLPGIQIDAIVGEGLHCGRVMNIDNGVVTQKINREGNTVRHDASRLSAEVQVGDVVDIQYRGGQGVVSGIGKGVGVGR